jgi:hypothetical protein
MKPEQKFYKMLKIIKEAKEDICEDSYDLTGLTLLERRRDNNDNQYSVYHHEESGKFIKIKEQLIFGCDGTERYLQWAKEANQITTTTYEYEELKETTP